MDICNVIFEKIPELNEHQGQQLPQQQRVQAGGGGKAINQLEGTKRGESGNVDQRLQKRKRVGELKRALDLIFDPLFFVLKRLFMGSYVQAKTVLRTFSFSRSSKLKCPPTPCPRSCKLLGHANFVNIFANTKVHEGPRYGFFYKG